MTHYIKDDDYQYLRGYLFGLQDFGGSKRGRPIDESNTTYYAGYQDGLADRYNMEEEELIESIARIRRQLRYYP